MSTELIKGYQRDDALRQAFNALAKETFCLNFEGWYQNGFWQEQYIPYSICIDGRIVSNVSVNLMDCEIGGQTKRYIQLGTVMTQKDCRMRGYNRQIMEEILRDWRDSDGIFLFGNDYASHYYPKFGFKPTPEFRYQTTVQPGAVACARPVPMETPADWQRFLDEKNRRVSNGVVRLRTDSLIMFYLTQYMRKSVFFLESLDAYVVAETDGDTLTLFDVYTPSPVDMRAVCASFGPAVRNVRFAFTPQDADGFTRVPFREDDCTFFVLDDRLARDMDTICSFPALAHA